MSMVKYRIAVKTDIEKICQFTDYWLAGRGIKENAPGATNDYFISPSQHKRYVTKYTTWIALVGKKIVGWLVIEPSGCVIHLLVSGYFRDKGIGSELVKKARPKSVRSKLDQASGDPINFYRKLGFFRVKTEQSKSRLDIDRKRPERPKNIDIMVKPPQAPIIQEVKTETLTEFVKRHSKPTK